MSTATDLVFKVSGNVAYTDGSSGPFEASYQNGVLISPFATTSADNFDELFGDKSTGVNALKNLLPGTITILFGSTSRTKTVDHWTMEISGRVSYNDGTSGDWTVQYLDGTVVDLAGDTHFTAALAVAGFVTQIRNVFRELASTTTVTA